MLGGMAAKWRWKADRKALGKPTEKPNLVCGPVQVCWAKFCRYWEIEKREIPMRPDMFHMVSATTPNSAKMPAPTIAPMPRAVTDHRFIEREALRRIRMQ